MGNVTVIGAQWGDEGKGKIVDWLASRADMVVRFQGGHNAGHTLVVEGKTYKLSLLPSGIVTGTPSVIGNGVVLDPWALKSEVERIREQGVAVTPEILMVADNCPLILPIHRDLDALLADALDLGLQRPRVEHHAVPDHRRRAAYDPARQERQLIGLVADDERVASVVTALEADDHVGAARQPIDDLALAFVAPLGTDHYHIRHRDPLRRSMIRQRGDRAAPSITEAVRGGKSLARLDLPCDG